jgi:HD-GYP domain-containing protein (c-di-GMP phosphodiesterase class II)/DNA-binding CsgD family transcriptional regulator
MVPASQELFTGANWKPHRNVTSRDVDTERGAVRLVEVLGVLSLATDVAMGQPMEHGLRTCLLAERLAAHLQLDAAAHHGAYELALLRWIGCTAHAHELSGWFDDEIAAHRRSALFDFGRPSDVLVDLLRYAGAGRSVSDRARTVAGALVGGPGAVHDLFASSCEVGGRLAAQLQLGGRVQEGLDHVFARWDGKGWPPSAEGEGVALIARVVHVAQDAAAFVRWGGKKAALEVIRKRSGRAYDPWVAGTFLAAADELLDAAEQPSLWDAVLQAEPGQPHYLVAEQVDAALEAMADFADLKSPWTAGHSRGVARLAASAAPEAGEVSAGAIGRAGLVHDLGRVGVPNGTWEKRGPLTAGEWERVRLHPYLTERILARSRALAPLGDMASLHHERLDGSGYHRGAKAATLPADARLLAVADAYQSLTSERPYRAALARDGAADVLRGAARSGRLDPEAVRAVLDVAREGRGGGAGKGRRTAWPAGLTDREVEILRLLARGLTRKQVAARLVISEKTAGHHAEHIYAKLGVSSRAAAALFAAQHDLV